MPSQLNPYLSFRDETRAAMEFYKSVFGGELTMATFEEFHASEDPAERDKIMHASLQAPNGITFMASDTPNAMEYAPGENMSMSLSGDDEAELRGYWEKLQPGATVVMPLEAAPWGATFGMLKDRFGVPWMVNITA
ncbi:MAG: VOC family protein [Dehalococcoidia bacterium]|nr:VOC family protein [Dehalococcoidia bacterium]